MLDHGVLFQHQLCGLPVDYLPFPFPPLWLRMERAASLDQCGVKNEEEPACKSEDAKRHVHFWQFFWVSIFVLIPLMCSVPSSCLTMHTATGIGFVWRWLQMELVACNDPASETPEPPGITPVPDLRPNLLPGSLKRGMLILMCITFQLGDSVAAGPFRRSIPLFRREKIPA